MRVNFHTHSTMSDGRLSPRRLVSKLASDKVEVFALTDHDTLDGLKEARKAATKKGIYFINGIEITTKINGLKIDLPNFDLYTLHILALGFDFERLTNSFAEGAHKRIPVDGLYNQHLDCFEIRDVVRMVHAAGGLVIWAHPYEILFDLIKRRTDENTIAKISSELKRVGVDGIESFYSRYNDNQLKFLRELQSKHKFIASAGTDYHAVYEGDETYVDIDASSIPEILSKLCLPRKKRKA